MKIEFPVDFVSVVVFVLKVYVRRRLEKDRLDKPNFFE